MNTLPISILQSAADTLFLKLEAGNLDYVCPLTPEENFVLFVLMGRKAGNC